MTSFVVFLSACKKTVFVVIFSCSVILISSCIHFQICYHQIQHEKDKNEKDKNEQSR